MSSEEDEKEMMSPPFNTQNEEGTSSGSVLKELSPKPEIQNTIYELQGKYYNPSTKEYEKIEGSKPIMNQQGINAFYQYATAFLSPIVTMSNYTNKYDMIHAEMRFIMSRVVRHFYINYRQYEIADKTHVNIITTKMLVLGISAFYKAIGAGDRKAGTSNIYESISTMMKGEEQKQNSSSGFLSKIMGK